MKKILFIFVILTLNFCTLLFAFDERLPAAARSAAFLGAYTALADDTEAIQLNPAGLGNIRDILLCGSGYQLFQTFASHTLLSAVVPLKKRYGSLGFSWRRMDYSREIRFSDLEDEITLAYGISFRSFSAGMNLQYNTLSSDSDSLSLRGTGGSAGLGLAYQLNKEIKFGCAVQNLINYKISGINADSREPLYSLGVSCFYQKWLLPSAEIRMRDNQFFCSLGTEFIAGDYLKFRCGLNEQIRFALGMGFTFQGLSMDYAYQSGVNSLSATHILSLSYRFIISTK